VCDANIANRKGGENDENRTLTFKMRLCGPAFYCKAGALQTEHGLAFSSMLRLADLHGVHAVKAGAFIHARPLGPFGASGLFRSALRS